MSEAFMEWYRAHWLDGEYGDIHSYVDCLTNGVTVVDEAAYTAREIADQFGIDHVYSLLSGEVDIRNVRLAYVSTLTPRDFDGYSYHGNAERYITDWMEALTDELREETHRFETSDFPYDEDDEEAQS